VFIQDLMSVRQLVIVECDGFSEDIELNIIGIAVKVETMVANDIAKGSRYIMKRRGPRTEPWGTPWGSRAVEEVQLFM